MPVLRYKDGGLCWGGVAIQQLADELGTPFFLLSEAGLRANYEALVRGISSAGG